MTATIIRPAVWAKALPQLPKAASKPDAPAIVRYVGDWLAVLEADPSRGPEFDRDLDLYAATLRQSGALTPHQGAGFLLALWAYQNVGNPRSGACGTASGAGPSPSASTTVGATTRHYDGCNSRTNGSVASDAPTGGGRARRAGGG
jgi:hypothetical protein